MIPPTFAPGTLFSRVFHASPVGMTVNLLPDGIYVDVNQAFAAMVGHTREELIGRRAVDLNIITPQERQPVINSLTGAGLLVNTPVLLRRPTGEVREGIVSAQLEEHEGQQYAIAIVQDLTEHHRAQAELMAAEVRFRVFFDNVPLPIWVFDLETLGILDANPAAAHAYGYSIDELLSMTILDIRPPADREALQSHLPHLWHNSGDSGVWRHQKKDGTPMDMSISGYTFELEGRRVRLAVLRDVTEQTAAERALFERAQQLKTITHLSTDGIWELDYTTGDYELNEAFRTVFGAPPAAEALLTWWFTRIHPDDRAGVDQFFRDAFSEGLDYWSTEYRMLRADGTTYANVLTRGRLTRNEHGQPARLVGALVDITAQMEVAEAATRATLEERERLARELHDSVTQSLYSVSLLAEVARRRAQSGDHVAVLEQIERLGELSQQCLREMRLLVYELRPPLVEEMGLAGALQHRLEAVEQRSGIRVTLRAGSDELLPNAVRNTLFRVGEEALNLSLKHSRASALTVRVNTSPSGVELAIADNGVGFAGAPAEGPELAVMRKRLSRLGGELHIDNAPGAPLMVRAWVPLEPATDTGVIAGDRAPVGV